MSKTASWIFGVIFVIAGIWGFFAPALGFIQANMVGSVIHLVVGVILLALASKPSAVMVLKTIGIIYVIWAIIGFLGWGFTGEDSVTTWFYLIVGVIIAVLGFADKKGAAPMAPSSPAPQM